MATSRIPSGPRTVYSNDGQKLANGQPKPPAFIHDKNDWCLPSNTKLLNGVDEKGKRKLATNKVSYTAGTANTCTATYTLPSGEVVTETCNKSLPASSKDAGVLQYDEPAQAPVSSDEMEETEETEQALEDTGS